MKATTVRPYFSKVMLSLMVGTAVFAWGAAQADPISPELQAKVNKYKKQLVEWAAEPQIVEAAKESNSKGGIPGMTNAKWDELGDSDPLVLGPGQLPVSKEISKWETNKGLDKLLLRDEKGNLAACASHCSKPLLYNNGNRPPFQQGLKAAWSAKEVKPDPTTQKKSVQVSVPVMEGGKAIGVLQTAVLAE
jgi:hypothetical protein